MRSKTAIVAVAVALSLQGAAAAADVTTGSNGTNANSDLIFAQLDYSGIIAGLESAGYEVTDMRSKSGNRIQVRARTANHTREMVINRSTGQIIKDVVRSTSASAEGATRAPKARNADTAQASSQSHSHSKRGWLGLRLGLKKGNTGVNAAVTGTGTVTGTHGQGLGATGGIGAAAGASTGGIDAGIAGDVAGEVGLGH